MNELENDLLLLAARLTIRTAGWKDAEAVGLELLLSGLDTPAIVELASISAGEEELELKVNQALEEMGMQGPRDEEIFRVAETDVARKVAHGDLDPYSGAKALRYLALDLPNLDLYALPYQSMVAGYEDGEEFREANVARIVARLEQSLKTPVFNRSTPVESLRRRNPNLGQL